MLRRLLYLLGLVVLPLVVFPVGAHGETPAEVRTEAQTPVQTPAQTRAPAGELGPGLVNPGYHEKPAWFKHSFLDIREDIAEATAAGKRVVLYFYQDGCPYCEKLLNTNFALHDVVEKTRTGFDVIAINMWGDREVTGLSGGMTTEKQFATDLRVMFTPTLLFLNESGAVVLRVNGYYPPHRFLAALEYVGTHAETKQSFREYLAAVEPVPAHGRLHQEPGYLQPPYGLATRGSGRPLAVFFEQTECAACDELHLDILQRAESRALLGHFDVALLDLWGKTPVTTPAGVQTTSGQWAQDLKVQYAPTVVLFDADGHEVFRAEAYLKAFHIQSVLDYVASGTYREQPSFQRFVQTRADALRAQGIPVDLME
ncbi:MAG: thioredoxin fold domain-containing protein [Gammaproteobacteria bacterium]|nr:thioredoxin fold domain-containing protein [Gammaproteobacteria bacterium]